MKEKKKDRKKYVRPETEKHKPVEIVRAIVQGSPSNGDG